MLPGVRLAAFASSLAILAVCASSTQTATTRTWAAQGASQSVRILPFEPSVTLGPGGQTLAVVGADRVVLRDTASGSVRYAFPDAGDAVVSVAFSPSGSVLAGVTQSARIVLWDAQSGFRRATLAGAGAGPW